MNSAQAPASDSGQPDLSRQRVLLFVAAVVLFLGALCIYLPRAAVTVQESDGAEFATAAVVGAVVHPPGYPLYMLMARGLAAVFPSNPYHALAVFAGVTQALAGALLLFACFALSRSVLLSAVIAGSWLLYEPVMRSAADAEVFALHHLLVAVLVLLCCQLLAAKERVGRRTFLLGVVCGLGGAHHLTIVLWAPLVLAVVWSVGFQRARAAGMLRLTGALCAGAVIGLLPYATLLLSGTTSLAFGPLQTLSDLLRHMLRLEYGAFTWHLHGTPHDVSYLPHLLRLSWKPIPLFVLAFPLSAVLVLVRRTPLTVGIFLACLLHGWFACKLVLPPFEVIHGEFVMRFYGMLALCGALAAAAVLPYLARRRMILVLLAAVICITALLELPHSLPGADNRRDRIIDFELEHILQEVPSGGVFVTSLDRIAMGLHYKQLVEHKRRDMHVLVGTMVHNERYRRILAERAPFLQEALRSEKIDLGVLAGVAVQSGHPVFAYQETRMPAGYHRWPLGVTWQWLPEHQIFPLEKTAARMLAFCGRWPDELSTVSGVRAHSRYIAHYVFLEPFRAFAKRIAGPELGREMQAAMLYVAGGAPRLARLKCQDQLENLTGSRDTAPRPYLY